RIDMRIIDDAISRAVRKRVGARRAVGFIDDPVYMIGVIKAAYDRYVFGAGGANRIQDRLQARMTGVSVLPHIPRDAMRFIQQSEQDGGVVFITIRGIAPECRAG